MAVAVRERVMHRLGLQVLIKLANEIEAAAKVRAWLHVPSPPGHSSLQCVVAVSRLQQRRSLLHRMLTRRGRKRWNRGASGCRRLARPSLVATGAHHAFALTLAGLSFIIVE